MDESAAIKAALERDPDINLHAWPITVRGNDVVHLEGEVENIVAKRKAYRIAREAAQTGEILDDLYVHVEGEHGDGEIRTRVLDALQGESAFQGRRISAADDTAGGADIDIAVAVADGRVILTGSAQSLSHRRLAEVLCWWVPGCRDVHNRLHVAPAEHDHDSEITDAIRLVLDKETALDGNEVHVETAHGEVTLSGRVHSDTLRRIAAYDCWYVPGVHAVHNRLEIRG